jgi:uncharacterized membrane protein
MQSKLAQVAAPVLLVLQELQFSSLQKMVHTHNSVCHLAKSVTSMFVAAQRSELSETQNNQISTTVKLDVCAGKAVAQPFVVLL